MSKRLEAIVKELFELIDKVECSDNNRYFFPTSLQFSSCRIMDGQHIGKIIEEMKQIVNAPPRMSEKEMHLLNNPDDCGECLGTGFQGTYNHCKACGGTGSTEPDMAMICPRCKGTGDTQNHERETNACSVCDTSGRVKICPVCEDGIINKLVKTVDWRDCQTCDGSGFLPVKDW